MVLPCGGGGGGGVTVVLAAATALAVSPMVRAQLATLASPTGTPL
jgi:hypothetical protein